LGAHNKSIDIENEYASFEKIKVHEAWNPKAFSYDSYHDEILMQNVNVKILPEKIFSELINLQSVHLCSNKIEELPADLFKSNAKSTSNSLNENRLIINFKLFSDPSYLCASKRFGLKIKP
jgi:hypothetical protein